ncbi:MAG: hypothetical protein AAF355_11860, partial [Myxococcota bacterium]
VPGARALPSTVPGQVGATSTLAASQRPPQDADAPRRQPPQGRFHAPYPVRFGKVPSTVPGQVGDAATARALPRTVPGQVGERGGRWVSGFHAPYPVRFGGSGLGR